MASSHLADALPCRHGLAGSQIQQVKQLLAGLPFEAPELLRRSGIAAEDYDILFRAAIESLRGTSSATTSDKRRLLETVLDFGVQQHAFKSWKFEGTENRQDYRVDLPDGTAVGIEAKGCPDGNNMTIWDRPGWANEFVVWSMCPESLAHDPGQGVWSGIATRLIPKLAAERAVVDAMVFFDARCGTEQRRCPKSFGVDGPLRSRLTSNAGQDGRAWVPPPCVYLLPEAPPFVRNNPCPRTHTLSTCHFADRLLSLFNVPQGQRERYVHSASVESRGSARGTQILVTVTSRNWPDGKERKISSRWKALRRET